MFYDLLSLYLERGIARLVNEEEDDIAKPTTDAKLKVSKTTANKVVRFCMQNTMKLPRRGNNDRNR